MRCPAVSFGSLILLLRVKVKSQNLFSFRIFFLFFSSEGNFMSGMVQHIE